jgi:hypothetical protein
VEPLRFKTWLLHLYASRFLEPSERTHLACSSVGLTRELPPPHEEAMLDPNMSPYCPESMKHGWARDAEDVV